MYACTNWLDKPMSSIYIIPQSDIASKSTPYSPTDTRRTT